MSTQESETRNTYNEEKIKEEYDKTARTIFDVIKEAELSRYEEEALRRLINILESYGYIVETVSDRNGFRIILVEGDDSRYLIWIRGAPVSRGSLELAERYTRQYEDITERILVKLTRKADYTKVVGWKKIIRGI